MIALICGTGDLPGILARRLIGQGTPPVICALAGFAPDVPEGLERLDFRLETLGTLLAALHARGVRRLCMAGLVRRPQIDPAAIDAATAPLVAALQEAMPHGDDGTLRRLTRILEAQGFTIIGADDIAPDLLATEGIHTRAHPGAAVAAALPLARATLANMGRADTGQACVLRGEQVIAIEGPEGTDAMLAAVPPGQGGFLFKGPKPGQERRVDLPAIGPETVSGLTGAGLDGVVAVADGTLVIGREELIRHLDDEGLFFWGLSP